MATFLFHALHEGNSNMPCRGIWFKRSILFN